MAEWIAYEKQLQDPRWRSRRDAILLRDNYKCQRCPRMEFLQVHHRYYESGKMAWEYPDSALVTLCRRCHAIEHGLIPEYVISNFDTRKVGVSRPVLHIRDVMIQFIEMQLNALRTHGERSAV